MTSNDCPFCNPRPERIFYEGKRIIGLWDLYPVSPGHALLAPRRHVESLLDLGDFERHELFGSIRTVWHEILRCHRADGFNIGVNNGAVAVHTGESSSPRADSLEQLNAGNIAVVFAVDMFNEGVDLPALDTISMLRPTESKILWLQQFGRGLRHAEGKDHLTVIDYIGNHRAFLLKPQTLFQLGSSDHELMRAFDQVQSGDFELPPGCEVTYELEAIKILKGLMKIHKAPEGALIQYYKNFKDLHDERPRAAEAFHDGYNPRSMRRSYGSWLRFGDSMSDLSGKQRQAISQVVPWSPLLGQEGPRGSRPPRLRLHPVWS